VTRPHTVVLGLGFATLRPMKSTAAVAKQDAQGIEWLMSSYLSAAKEDIALDRKLSMMLFGRDIKYVLLLHIGASDSIMLPDLLELSKKQGFDFVSLEEAEKDIPTNSKDLRNLPIWGGLHTDRPGIA